MNLAADSLSASGEAVAIPPESCTMQFACAGPISPRAGIAGVIGICSV